MAVPAAHPPAGAASRVRMASIGAAVRRLSLSQDTRADSRRTRVCRRKTCAPPNGPRAATVGLYDHKQWPDGPFACDFVLVTEDLSRASRAVRGTGLTAPSIMSRLGWHCTDFGDTHCHRHLELADVRS